MNNTNPVTWFSIPSDDLDKAAEFYKQAFSWDILPRTKENNPDFDYNITLNSPSDEEFISNEPGRLNGCLVKKSTGIRHPVVLVETEDLDETAKKVVAAGGKVLSDVIPMDTLNGKLILVEDLDGNMIEIFKKND